MSFNLHEKKREIVSRVSQCSTAHAPSLYTHTPLAGPRPLPPHAHQPLFAQERAPTSVAYAETQSMFLDSLVGDTAWRAKYAKKDNGERIPWDLIEEDIKCVCLFILLWYFRSLVSLLSLPFDRFYPPASAC